MPFLRLAVCFFVAVFSSTAFAVDPFSIPLDQVVVLRAEHVVSFRTIGFARSFAGGEDLTRVEVELRTRAGVRLYAKGVNFSAQDSSGFAQTLAVNSNPPASKYFDNWYKEEREFYTAGTIFTLSSLTPLIRGAEVRVRFEACNDKTCLMPTTFSLKLTGGAFGVSVEAVEAPQEVRAEAQVNGAGAPPIPSKKVSLPLKTPAPSVVAEKTPAAFVTPDPTFAPTPSATPAPVDKSVIESQISESVRAGSIWLWPLLFLAGLIMNLTPCVYPMIPITLSVLSRFGKKGGHAARWYPMIFVLGMAGAYSIMGLVAGLSGSVFGTILQSVWVSAGISGLMFLMGLMMVGLLDLSKIQQLGSRIPLSETHPGVAVFAMGAVSGLVSAPCTGPVLATLLLIVSQTQDAFRGFVLLFVFSLGFGAPYLVMGSLMHKARRLPHLGFFEEFVKLAFAALMFALSLYYARQLLGGLEFLQWIYQRPSLVWVLVVAVFGVLLGALAWKISDPTAELEKKALHWAGLALRGLLMVPLTALALWLTLYTLNAFPASEVSVHWEKSWAVATARARAEGKPLLVDVWADWCAACKEMDAELWARPEVASLLNSQFVTLKLDFTEESAESQKLAKEWNLGGLPAIGIYAQRARLEAPPTMLIREKVEYAAFVKSVSEVLEQSR
jgi:thiol:disulfide interchange protein DsbD